MLDHLQKIYDLHGDNEYREGRGLTDKPPYSSKQRNDNNARKKAGIQPDDVKDVTVDDDDWMNC